jgi:hypothetical protein
MLVEIATAEPIRLNELRARSGKKGSAFEKTAGRLLALGLVYRERRRVRGRRKKKRLHLGLATGLYIAPALRALLAAIRNEPADLSAGRVLRLFVIPTDADNKLTYDFLFGSRVRTLAIIVVALLGFSDASTIGRVVGVDRSGNLNALLEPLTRDGIFTNIRYGRMRLFSLSRERWSESLEALCWRLAEVYPRLRSIANSAEMLRNAGTSPARKFFQTRMR